MTVLLDHLPIKWNIEEQIDNVHYFGDPPVSPDSLKEIRELRESFGEELLVLGHHYQRDEIIQFADKIEDSLALSQFATNSDKVKTILFLGIHIMAETADMLTPRETAVILPDLNAGCTMGDYAPRSAIEQCWADLSAIINIEKITPISYVNATAAVKAFSGLHNGCTCTSANTAAIMSWALEQTGKVLFLPDRNLGRNTAFSLGIPDDKVILWDPSLPLGGNSIQNIRDAKVIAWKGFCSIHEHFTTKHAEFLRKEHPGIKILVHPEVGPEIFRAADDFGSTSQIIDKINNAEPGSVWAVGTEYHMVNRLAESVRDKGIKVLNISPFASLCAPMFRINAEAVLASLRALKNGEYRYRVQVDDDTREMASIALKRMFGITG